MKKELNKDEEIVTKNQKFSKGVVALVALGAASSAFATTTTADSFGDLFTTFKNWLQGDLGRLLALLGFAGTFIIYLMTHKGSVLIIGVVISLVAGGLVSISSTFFNMGTTVFTTY